MGHDACSGKQGEKMAEESIRTHQLSKVNKRPGRGLAEATLGISWKWGACAAVGF